MYLLIVHPNCCQPLFSASLDRFDQGGSHVEISRLLKGQVSRQPVLLALDGIEADFHPTRLSTLS